MCNEEYFLENLDKKIISNLSKTDINGNFAQLGLAILARDLRDY